jgi:hypothetical protein
MYYPKVFYICVGGRMYSDMPPTNFIMNSYKSIEKGKGLVEWRVFFFFALSIMSEFQNLLSDWYKCVYLNSFFLFTCIMCTVLLVLLIMAFMVEKGLLFFNFVNSQHWWSFTRGISQILVTCCQKGKLVKVETSLSVMVLKRTFGCSVLAHFLNSTSCMGLVLHV